MKTTKQIVKRNERRISIRTKMSLKAWRALKNQPKKEVKDDER